MYVMLTNHRWKKDADSQRCFEDLIQDAGFPKHGNLTVICVDAEFEDISVDGMGTVHFPKASKFKRTDLDLDQFSDWIEKWQKHFDECLIVKEDFWYTEIYDLIPPED